MGASLLNNGVEKKRWLLVSGGDDGPDANIDR